MKIMLTFLILTASLAAVGAESYPDASFYKKAAEAGIAEVDAGNLAEQKGNNQAVKDFGAMMVKDHTAANDKLKALAASKNISLPTSASMGEMATKGKLDLLSGDTFDKSYIKSQLKDHRAAIAGWLHAPRRQQGDLPGRSCRGGDGGDVGDGDRQEAADEGYGHSSVLWR